MREAKFTKPLSLAVQPDLYQKIKEITDYERISIAEWFRRVAEEALSNFDKIEKGETEGRS